MRYNTGAMPRALSPLEQKLNAFVAHLLPIPFQHKIVFVQHLRIMLKAGLSLVEALNILIQQTTNHKLKGILVEVLYNVEKGRSLSDVLRQYPKALPLIYTRMMAAGEASGTMETALLHIEEQMKRSHELASRIRGAMIYPCIIIIALVGIAFEMLYYVLPKLIVVFAEFEARLPLATRILIAVSNFVVAYGIWLLIGAVAFIVGFILLYRTEKFKTIIHRLILRFPIICCTPRKINCARFSSTLTSLLGSGISIIDAMKITSDVLINRPYRNMVIDATSRLKKGTELSKLLAVRPDLFPPMVTGMIGTGEKTGKIEELLAEVSAYYNEDVEKILKNLNTIIEPLIILFLGVVVAAMAIAVVMPMLTLTQNI